MERSSLQKLNVFLVLFFGISLFFFLLLNGGAYARELRYTLFLNSPFASNDLKEGDILRVSDPNSSSSLEFSDLAPGQYQLIIPKIEVDTPIAIPRANDTKSILASLEKGVGLYPDSTPIGTPNGRSVLLGHSSRASWYRGEYATVFALLPKLEPLDEIYIVGENKKYTYRVFSKKILTPSDTNKVLQGHASGSEIDLITCYPIGSASKRNLFQASLISVENL